VKKPIILLVDDEVAVLEALEAALTPRFTPICRVESFDDPGQVLEALPAWEAEDRRIAVAVVDQKMPGMTGVDLLCRMKETAPARQMRSAMLTGYAELDSAVAAKNRAGIDRYFEKPWNPDALTEAVENLLDLHLSESGAHRHLLLTEVTGEDDLAEHLLLRLEIQRRTMYLPFSRAAGFDVDAYDGVSRFFSAFAASGSGSESAPGADSGSRSGSRLLAVIRVIGKEKGPAYPALEKLTGDHAALRQRLQGKRITPLRLMQLDGAQEALEPLMEKLIEEGAEIVECGQLAIDPGAGVHTGAQIAELARELCKQVAAAVYLKLEATDVFQLSPAPKAHLYRSLGFQPVPGIGQDFDPRFGDLVVCLPGKVENAAPPVREELAILAQRLKRTGSACLCPTFPACLGEPYETGDFRTTDLFCPLLACAE
jgi:CheY-like chemotaxis protein